MTALTMDHWKEVLDKEISFGIHVASTKSKKITYNPLSQMTFVYSDGGLVDSSPDLEAMIDLYNSISVR